MAQQGDTWIEESDVVPMFPTLVWKIQVRPELQREIDAGIVAVLEAMRKDLPRVGPAHGWQSSQNLHERAELRELVRCIDKAALSVLRFNQGRWRAIAVDIGGAKA